MRRAVAVFLQVVGACAVVGGALVVALLLLAGYWMRVDDAPRPSDAIVVVNGDLHRPIYAADLYNEGYAPEVWFGRPHRDPEPDLEALGMLPPPQEMQYAKILREKGVPDAAMHIFGHGHQSTVEEAEALARALGPARRKLLLVTSPYHARRAKLAFRHALPNCDIRMACTPYEPYETLWWTTQRSAQAVVMEAAKTAYHLFGGVFRAHPRPAGD